MDCCASSFSDLRQLTNFVQKGMRSVKSSYPSKKSTSSFHPAKRTILPTKDHVNSGLFSEHYFNIGNEPFTELVEARFFYTEFNNPVYDKNEKYFMIGMAGSEDGKNLRKKTDLILVLDRSGSMGSFLNDTLSSHNYGTDGTSSSPQKQKTKMDLTIEAAKEIFNILDDDECFGAVAFDNVVEIIEILKPKGEIDKDRLFDHLDTVNSRGGTNMEIGMEKAIQMMMNNNHMTNKRIVFITDDCPNIGKDEKGLRAMAERAFVESSGTIGITYVGVGLSFNVHVSEELSKVRGTTIFSVTTSRQLKQTLVDDFNYLVSPIATDVTVSLNINGYAIDAVYGTDADAIQGEKLFHFRTLTSSAISEKGVKGAAILVKLKENEKSDDHVKIEIEYTPYLSNESVKSIFESKLVDEKNSEIQKAIILGIYMDVMKDILPDSEWGKSEFTPEDKEKLQRLKDLMITQPDQIKKDLSNELDVLERLLLL